MAVPLSDGAGPRVPLIDTHGGHEDLEAGVLRILQPHSFADDPTRAIRAARYASRFDLELEPETGRRLREADLATISAERRWAELLRLAGEASAPRGLALLVEWGLVESRPGGVELASAVASLLESGPWEGEVLRAEALLDALLGPVGREQELAAEPDPSPSRGVELAARGALLRSWRWRERWARPGSTPTFASGARSSSRSAATTCSPPASPPARRWAAASRPPSAPASTARFAGATRSSPRPSPPPGRPKHRHPAKRRTRSSFCTSQVQNDERALADLLCYLGGLA